MRSDFSYDPVTATDEASATGETAAIFADIRQTMGIPLVTSIWRGLAGMGDSLKQVWALTKPIYATGLPEQALDRMIVHASLPRPERVAPAQLTCVGIGRRDLQDIRTIVAAYNRSNGMNLIALAALVTPPASGDRPDPVQVVSPAWPSLRPLPAREAISADTWTMIQYVNSLGATSLDAGVATLWRHLAHWPGLLALVYSAFGPLQSNGIIADANRQMVDLATKEGSRLAWLRPAKFDISQQARKTVTEYVNVPTHVARMVTMGHALEMWLP